MKEVLRNFEVLVRWEHVDVVHALVAPAAAPLLDSGSFRKSLKSNFFIQIIIKLVNIVACSLELKGGLSLKKLTESFCIMS